MSSDTEMKMQIFDLKTSKDVHVLTVYVDNNEVRIVAVLGNLAWLPVGWREKLSELLKPSSEPNGVARRGCASCVAVRMTKPLG